MFINTFNVFFPYAIIVLSCKFPMLQLRFLYNIRCNFLPSSPANSTFHSPLRMERGVKNTLDHRQGKSSLKKPPQAPPEEGMSLSPLTYIWLFQIICNKDIPSFGGAWGGFL